MCNNILITSDLEGAYTHTKMDGLGTIQKSLGGGGAFGFSSAISGYPHEHAEVLVKSGFPTLDDWLSEVAPYIIGLAPPHMCVVCAYLNHCT